MPCADDESPHCIGSASLEVGAVYEVRVLSRALHPSRSGMRHFLTKLLSHSLYREHMHVDSVMTNWPFLSFCDAFVQLASVFSLCRALHVREGSELHQEPWWHYVSQV